MPKGQIVLIKEGRFKDQTGVALYQDQTKEIAEKKKVAVCVLGLKILIAPEKLERIGFID